MLGHLDICIKTNSLCCGGFPFLDTPLILRYSSIPLVSGDWTDVPTPALGTIWCLQSTNPGLSLYSKVPIAFGTAYYVLSLSVNIVVTILIVFRLVMHRRAILESLPPEHASHYLSVATIIVESAALYSLFSLAFIITYAVSNPINQIFLTLSSTSQVCAYFLVRLCRD